MDLVTQNFGKDLNDFFEKNIDRVFDQTWSEFWPGRTTRRITNNYPRVNILETENDIQLFAEVPGFKENEIHLEIKEGILNLRSNPTQDVNQEGKSTYHVREFSQSAFNRSFRLGDQVDTDKVTAKLENGILHVTLAKKEKAKPKKVEIKISS